MEIQPGDGTRFQGTATDGVSKPVTKFDKWGASATFGALVGGHSETRAEPFQADLISLV